MSCIEECLIHLNAHHTASFAFQRLPNGPEILSTRWWVQSQTSGRQQHRGLCETKQPTSCSVEPGRSFFGCSSVWTGLGKAGARREQPEATRARKHACNAYIHIQPHVHSCFLELHIEFFLLILAACERTSWHVDKRKLCVKMSHIVTNGAKSSGCLWLMLSI